MSVRRACLAGSPVVIAWSLMGVTCFAAKHYVFGLCMHRRSSTAHSCAPECGPSSISATRSTLALAQ